MKELAQSFLGENVSSTKHFIERQNEVYEAVDTVKQYLEHYNMIMKGGLVVTQPQMHAVTPQKQSHMSVNPMPDLR